MAPRLLNVHLVDTASNQSQREATLAASSSGNEYPGQEHPPSDGHPARNGAAPRVQTISIRTLRKVILAALTLGLLVFTVGVLVLVNQIFGNFGPGVQADLEWKTTRGARELAQASELGLAAGDPGMVQAGFEAFSHSDDVVAIVVVNAAGKPLATFRKSPEAAETLFVGAPGAVRHTPAYYVGWAAATIEGATVGRVALVISTRRLVDSERWLKQVELIVGLGGALGLIAGCLFVVFFTGAILKRDAQLAEHAATLERKVEERTAELDDRNRGMRLVLDNVGQGFVTIALDGVMAPERSAIVHRWLGEVRDGQTFADYLGRLDPKAADWLRMGIEEIASDIMPIDVLLDQLPKRTRIGERTLKLDYTPITRNTRVERVLVVMTDISLELQRERMERQQREMLALFQALSTDRAGLVSFMDEANKLVEALRPQAGADFEVQKRLVHTLKGNAGLYQLDALVQVCHEVESRMVDEATELAEHERTAIFASWERVQTAVGDLMGDRVASLVIDESDFSGLLSLVRRGATNTVLERVIQSWRLEPVWVRFERLAQQVRQLSSRLGKPAPEVRIEAGSLRLDAARWGAFWSAFVHVARNAVDHGLEDPAERQLLGKVPVGALWLSADLEEGQVVVRLRDDGRGIDWEKLAGKAKAKGLPHDTRAALEAALFADGVSTRDAVTVVSGRGVGMSAVKEAVTKMGGVIAIHSERNVGTTFEFRVPGEGAFQNPDGVRNARPAFRLVNGNSTPGAMKS
jgi:HPt (histidine-containing phosphotransfer) domain-containing protein